MVAASAMLLFSDAAVAETPDWRAKPRYDTVNLDYNFKPDPYKLRVQAGGSGNAQSISKGCAGFIDFSRPDVDLNYEAGKYVLSIFAEGPSDLTLVVLDPEGDWFCNDDYHNTDPGIEIASPKSGNYNIWIGTYGGSIVDSTLYFSEAEPFEGVASGGSSVNFGDNRSSFAYDNECDDDRFVGQGMASTFIDEDRFHDAADCQALYEQGRIRLR